MLGTEEMIHRILTDTITSMCLSGVPYNVSVRVEGIIAITIDTQHILLLKIDKEKSKLADGKTQSGASADKGGRGGAPGDCAGSGGGLGNQNMTGSCQKSPRNTQMAARDSGGSNVGHQIYQLAPGTSDASSVGLVSCEPRMSSVGGTGNNMQPQDSVMQSHGGVSSQDFMTQADPTVSARHEHGGVSPLIVVPQPMNIQSNSPLDQSGLQPPQLALDQSESQVPLALLDHSRLQQHEHRPLGQTGLQDRMISSVQSQMPSQGCVSTHPATSPAHHVTMSPAHHTATSLVSPLPTHCAVPACQTVSPQTTSGGAFSRSSASPQGAVLCPSHHASLPLHDMNASPGGTVSPLGSSLTPSQQVGPTQNSTSQHSDIVMCRSVSPYHAYHTVPANVATSESQNILMVKRATVTCGKALGSRASACSEVQYSQMDIDSVQALCVTQGPFSSTPALSTHMVSPSGLDMSCVDQSELDVLTQPLDVGVKVEGSCDQVLL